MKMVTIPWWKKTSMQFTKNCQHSRAKKYDRRNKRAEKVDYSKKTG